MFAHQSYTHRSSLAPPHHQPNRSTHTLGIALSKFGTSVLQTHIHTRSHTNVRSKLRTQQYCRIFGVHCNSSSRTLQQHTHAYTSRAQNVARKLFNYQPQASCECESGVWSCRVAPCRVRSAAVGVVGGGIGALDGAYLPHTHTYSLARSCGCITPHIYHCEYFGRFLQNACTSRTQPHSYMCAHSVSLLLTKTNPHIHAHTSRPAVHSRWRNTTPPPHAHAHERHRQQAIFILCIEVRSHNANYVI